MNTMRDIKTSCCFCSSLNAPLVAADFTSHSHSAMETTQDKTKRRSYEITRKSETITEDQNGANEEGLAQIVSLCRRSGHLGRAPLPIIRPNRTASSESSSIIPIVVWSMGRSVSVTVLVTKRSCEENRTEWNKLKKK